VFVVARMALEFNMSVIVMERKGIGSEEFVLFVYMVDITAFPELSIT
jgi:hypothetical protein